MKWFKRNYIEQPRFRQTEYTQNVDNRFHDDKIVDAEFEVAQGLAIDEPSVLLALLEECGAGERRRERI